MRSGWLAVLLLLCAPMAGAQFKWVDSSGHVGYGDKPPPGAHDIESLEGVSKGVRPDPLAQLPYGLQVTVKEFPVTLYTMAECAACDSGRALLKARAVPYSERTVRNADDVQLLKQLSGSDQLPVFQVGRRFITGFNSGRWDEALDLAGYPRQGQLPAGWSWPAPTPLTGAKAAPAPAAPAAEGLPPGAPQ